MTERPSQVFDILHPSPVSLKELSAMAVSLEIWRREVDKYRSNCTLDEFKPSKLEIPSKTVLPDLPSVLYGAIDKYIRRLGPSMDLWLRQLHLEGFNHHYNHKNHILIDFDDFVCDYNGTIDYHKTAERMMQCDRFNVDKKFVIACLHCFEDDIGRFWPLVCEKIDSSVICGKGRMDSSMSGFMNRPTVFYYWICRLRNELDKITIEEPNESINERMLDNCMSFNNRSMEYFWNRIPLERKMRKAEDLIYFHDDFCTRFILPKLNDQQINELMNKEEENLVDTWLANRNYDEEVILQLWNCFKNFINPKTFQQLIVRMLGNTAMSYRGPEDGTKNFDDEYIAVINKKWTYLASEIWNSAPDRLKRSTIDDILFQSGLFKGTWSLYVPYNVGILLTILPYASLEDRNEFWDYAWPKLIDRTRGEYLQRIMELCFKNQDEISHFKQNVLSKSQDVKELCVSYLRGNCFDYANDLVDFCCSDVQTARIFRQQLLQSAFRTIRPLNGRFMFGIFYGIDRFNEFIINAFENEDQASDFKNQLMLSHYFQTDLLEMVPSHCHQLMKFVNAFVSSEETLQQVKTKIREAVKSVYRKARYSDDPRLWMTYDQTFMLWCLGSEEKLSDFNRKYVYKSSDNSWSDSDDSFDDYCGFRRFV